MNLENLNLVELNAQEVQEVEGGRISKKTLKTLNKILTGIGFYDAVDDFVAGWNSVE